MNRPTALRWSALAAIAGGMINPLVDVLSPARGSPLEWGYFIGGLAIQLALIGIYAIQVEESGGAGFLGFVMATAGRAYFSVPGAVIGGVDGTVPLGLLYMLGLILVSVGTLKSRKLPSWVPAMWLAAVVVGLAGALLPSLELVLLRLGAIVLGLGFVGAGFALWRIYPLRN